MKHMKWLRGLALALALLLSVAVLAEAAELETSTQADPGIEEEEIPGGEIEDGNAVDAGQDLALSMDGVELGEVDDDLAGLEAATAAGETASDGITPPADAPVEPQAPAAQGESDAQQAPADPDDKQDPAEGQDPAPEQPAEGQDPAPEQPAEGQDPAPEQPAEGQDPAPEQPAEGQDPAPEQSAEGQDPASEQPAEGQDPAPEQPAEGQDPAPEQPAEGQDPALEQPAEGQDLAPEGEASEGETMQLEAAQANDAKPVYPRSLTLGLKESTRLDATGELEGAVCYVSSKPKVVTVNSATGQIWARKKGTAVIAAYNADKKMIYCTVKVMKAPKKVKLNTGWMALNPEGSARLGVILPKKTASLARNFASSNPQVATVDSQGLVRAVNPGTAVVSVRTFNGKYASCRVVVLNGPAPKSLQLNRTSAAMGVKEKLQLVPTIDDGAAAAYAWSTSNRKIATVSGSGLVTARKKGTVRITVTTHNGLRQVCTIRVYKAPKKVSLSASSLRLTVGATARLTAWLPKGSGSVLNWTSSNAAVASVDGSGLVTARAAGSARIAVYTYNRKVAYCNVQVTNPGEPMPETSLDTMLNNLRRSSAVGTKRDAILNIVELLVKNGFEPAFAAGVAGNIKLEGSYGQFENSNYATNPRNRPRYFAYLDGGEYYKNGVLDTVYVPRDAYATTTVASGVTKAYSYGELNYYKNRYYRKYAWQVNLNELESFVTSLRDEGWTGKFGLGLVQWTAGRTKTLLTYYRKYAGDASTLTQAQVIAAENEMIMAELKGSYAHVYSQWKSANAGRLTGADAAASAASIFCLKYEIPANKEAAATARAAEARILYNAMMG